VSLRGDVREYVMDFCYVVGLFGCIWAKGSFVHYALLYIHKIIYCIVIFWFYPNVKTLASSSLSLWIISYLNMVSKSLVDLLWPLKFDWLCHCWVPWCEEMVFGALKIWCVFLQFWVPFIGMYLLCFEFSCYLANSSG
jgi:hypothetical protein